MAGDWIKVELCTPEKSEVLAITAIMGWDDPDLTVGKLFRLWRWFDQQTVNGNAASVTFALLDRIIGVTGFCEAVQKVGWLAVNEDGISLPGFEKHNGNTAKNRALTARRVAKFKENLPGNGEGNEKVTLQPLPREEKRREEKRKILEAVAPGYTGEETSEQKRLRSACIKNREKIIERFKHCETVFDHEVDKMVSFYAQRPIGIDPMYTVLNWFEKMKKPEPVKDTSGPYIPKGDDEIYIAAMKRMGVWDE